MTWKFIASSVTGKSHSDRNEPGQDYCRAGVVSLAGKEYFIGIASDGAGSTAWGGEGARIACETTYQGILETIRQAGDNPGIEDTDIRNWICTSRGAIEEHAKSNNRQIKEYACTLIGAVSGNDRSTFFQIGDGGIVVNNQDSYDTIFWPEQGEYANTTFFVSDETFLDHVKINRRDTVPEKVALFTDGLQNLVLSYATKTAHAGFFSPLFEALRKNPDNEITDLSSCLGRFLVRPDISQRSDDDKTLILAMRIPAGE